MRNYVLSASLLLFTILCQGAVAAEPNETFATATALASGVLTVSDELTPGVAGEPDTLLGVRGQFGQITFVDDDGSIYGNGVASGVFGVPTNSGSIDFAISGFGDDGFVGSHSESGSYEVFIDVYDFFDDLIDSHREIRTLEPGVVHEYSFNDAEWIGGSYDAYINNTIADGGDVDFFTFTGLTPGEPFAAETFDPTETGVDTTLGWFDETGALLALNDDVNEGTLLSLIEGTVPANGELTFAVTGYSDINFLGRHFEGGLYELRLETAAGSPADFNNDTVVDGLDLAEWKVGFGDDANGDADGDTDTDGDDFLIWQRELGSGANLVAGAAVPEPGTTWLLLAAAGAMAATRRPS